MLRYVLQDIGIAKQQWYVSKINPILKDRLIEYIWPKNLEMYTDISDCQTYNNATVKEIN
jgi:hypothetical protein